MIGFNTRISECAFNNIKAGHTIELFQIPTLGKLASVTQMRRATAQKICIKRQNNIGLFNRVQWLQCRAKRGRQACDTVIRSCGFMLNPSNFRVIFKKFIFDLMHKRRRSDGFCQQIKTLALGQLRKFSL